MQNFLMGAAGALAVACVSTPSAAEPYVDYTPQKGYWTINAVEVDPNHVDDYLTGLRSSQASAFEVLKRRGLIDDYRFMVRTGYVKGSPNVLIMTHSPTTATMAMNTVTTRQKVSLRRMRRRSTMKSASNDMALFPQN